MISIDAAGLKLCTFQAEIFRESLFQLACGSRIFIRRFMNSDLASRLDAKGFLYESSGVRNALEELELQYGASAYGSFRYPAEEMYWIGYLYRYWAYTYGKSSRQLYKFMKPEELSVLYYPYHSLDPAQAIERILESKGVSDEDAIARGVAVLRRVRG